MENSARYINFIFKYSTSCIEVHMRKEIHIHKQKLIYFFNYYFNIPVLLAPIILKKLTTTTTDWKLWMLCQSLMNLTEWCNRQVTCRQLISNVKHVKSYRKFTQSCTVTASSGLEIIVKSAVCIIKHFALQLWRTLRDACNAVKCGIPFLI